MKTVGIIAEYDPFHNGHAYHLKKAKEITGADAVVAVISGSFTQRGDAAFYSKKTRARAALAAGADLVLELPYIYACNAGTEFARGGTAVLDSIGVVTDLVFGSECGDIDLLKKAADISRSEDGRKTDAGSGAAERKEEGILSGEIRKNIRRGMTYPAAFGQAVSEVMGDEAAGIFRNPNDVLGISYIAALNRLRSEIEPHCIARRGAGHNDLLPAAGGKYEADARPGGETEKAEQPVVSGPALRNLIRREGIRAAESFLPEESYQIFENELFFSGNETLYRFLRYKLLTTEEKRLEEIYSVTEGIQNRMKAAAAVSESYGEYMKAVKTKRYTWAQIQRMNIHILMDFTKESYQRLKGTAYARVLGFSPAGAKLLRRIRKESGTEIISNLSGLSGLNPRTADALNVEMKAGDLRNLLMGRPVAAFSERKYVPVKAPERQ